MPGSFLRVGVHSCWVESHSMSFFFLFKAVDVKKASPLKLICTGLSGILTLLLHFQSAP